MSAPERRKSEGSPTLAAMMKSAGEQSAGQAVLQGFSSQYSHRFSSARNWASVERAVILFHGLFNDKMGSHNGNQRAQGNNTAIGVC